MYVSLALDASTAKCTVESLMWSQAGPGNASESPRAIYSSMRFKKFPLIRPPLLHRPKFTTHRNTTLTVSGIIMSGGAYIARFGFLE